MSDDGSTASEEDWSDSSDDHALSRTASGTSLVDLAIIARADTGAAIVASGDDYFGRPTYAEARAMVNNGGADVAEDDKNAAITVTEVTNPLSDLMDELWYGKSPPKPLQKAAGAADNVAADAKARERTW